MHRLGVFVFLGLFLFNQHNCFAQNAGKNGNKLQKRVMVFYKTEGFWHKSIPAGLDLIKELASDHSFKVTTTKDGSDFNGKNLAQFNLVIFLNTTGNVLNESEQGAFEKYIKNGGNFFGIHAAADTEFEWPWFGKLVGGYFAGHPQVQEADIHVNMPKHPTVRHLPKIWTRTDEWYNYKKLNPEMQVLLYLDENSYEGGTNGDAHPIAWMRKTGYGGISIYTGLGHTIQSYSEPDFKEHILQSILYILNEVKK